MRHDTPAFKKLAEDNTILRCAVGSTVHGISVGGDDRDEMGICIEPPQYLIGLQRFDQYEHHTAWERPGGLANRSGPGDLDVTIYSFRKWMRLALQGNPSILMPLFVHDNDIVEAAMLGWALRVERDRIISKQAGYRFLGYLRAQRDRLLGLRSAHVNRPELIEVHGYDTKFAGHAIRLGVQGIELMRTGTVILPMTPQWRKFIVGVRQGDFSKDTAIEVINTLEWGLKTSIDETFLPEYPDYAWADDFLAAAYFDHWGVYREVFP